MRLPSDPFPASPPLTLAEARARCVAAMSPPVAENVALRHAVGRTLAEPLRARHDQPPFAASAMDGYAVRFADVAEPLILAGAATAGHPFLRALAAGEAVRIGTGAMMPGGADHVLIQEEAELKGDRLLARAEQARPGNVRAPGRDFTDDTTLLPAGTLLQPRHLGLVAASGSATIPAARRPRVGVLTSGDELVDPGQPLGLAQIVDSASVGLPALIDGWGGWGAWIGRAPDEMGACVFLWSGAAEFDLLVTVGGASVGERDLLRASLSQAGGTVEWAKVAIRPGKPSWGGRIGDTPVLGLPGNPAAALVTARLLLQPMIAAALGRPIEDAPLTGLLAAPLPANGWRQAHERARHWIDRGGAVRLQPEADGDSSRLSPFATCDALIDRPADAPAAEVGDRVPFRLI